MRIISKFRSISLVAGFMAVLASNPCVGEFALPAAGPVAFRMDRVPLDEDTISGLTRDLLVLASTQAMESAAARRNVAQFIALTLALDPGNKDGRKLMASCRRGTHKPVEDAVRRDQSAGKIHALIEWLKSPVAGTDGQALAACLTDVLVRSADPSASMHEAGAWSGWIPDISAYEKPAEVVIAQPQKDAPQLETVKPVRPTLALEKAQMDILAWEKKRVGSRDEWQPAVSVLKMTSSVANEFDAPFSLRILPSTSSREEMAQMLISLLKTHHEATPKGIRVRLQCSAFLGMDEEKNEENSNPLPRALTYSAAAAVLASASITGNEPDAIVLGDVDSTGRYRMSKDLWAQILALQPGNGRRLVLPPQAADLMKSLLAVGKPEFFMDYEVLLARDFGDLLDLSAKNPPESVATASSKFQLIRTRMGSENVRSYVVNKYVRPRLSELANTAPNHASAAMLLIQSGGNRPTTVSRFVLTTELLDASHKLAWIARSRNRVFDTADIDLLAESSDIYRKRIDELEKLAAKPDLHLIESARLIALGLREMERAARTRGEVYEKVFEMQRARSEFINVITEHKDELSGVLSKLIEP